MKTVLILEDEPAILDLIRRVLDSAGYAPLEAMTAREAFLRFEENDAQIDLLIADVVLPVSSGIRVALELRSLLPNLRIILTSGLPPSCWGEQDAAEFNELPSDSVVTLQKPFPPPLILEHVKRLVGPALTTAPGLKARA